MRPPHQKDAILNNIAFNFEEISDLIKSVGDFLDENEILEIKRLFEMGLPPICSTQSLAAMTGYHPYFIWSLYKSTKTHYRRFEIPKGKSGKMRVIHAPRVALKVIQKWLSIQFENKWTTHDSVHGFVTGRSHITAAQRHLGQKWVLSVDIKDFFPTTNAKIITECLKELGYSNSKSLEILKGLVTYNDALPQGAPTSPVLSNIALHKIDIEISEFTAKHNCIYTRYADDIVISGKENVSDLMYDELINIFNKTCWKLAEKKVSFSQLPNRLKVHGLLVHGEKLRLTKGYRNRIRAYKYLLSKKKIIDSDFDKVTGHLNYANQIDNFQQKTN